MNIFGPMTFVRVYELPEKLVTGFCFGGGVPITFKNVDWFETSIEGGKDEMIDWIKIKNYYSPNRTFLVLADDPEFTCVIGPITRSMC